MDPEKVKLNKNNLPQVVLFGKVNVGKSNLFNRLTSRSQALVSSFAGTTRDANEGVVEWQGKEFSLIDTGGVIELSSLFKRKASNKSIEEKVQKQVRKYLLNARLVLFVVDVKEGFNEEDHRIAITLKKVFRNTSNVILVANKADNPKDRSGIADFFKLSIGDPCPVSAHTGSGTGDLLDMIVSRIKSEVHKKKEIVKEDSLSKNQTIRVSIIGKPNAGKSSLINKIIGKEKAIVSSIPHTTRESQDSVIEYKDQEIKFIDTAGLARKQHRRVKQNVRMLNKLIKNEEDLHALGMADSLSNLRSSDIALYMVDINKELTQEDLKIVEEIVNKRASVIIVANKWDIVEERDVKKYTEYIYDKLPFIKWAPIVFVSAKTGLKVEGILDLILSINKVRGTEISKSVLNKFLLKLVKRHKPAKAKGLKHPRIYDLSQTGTNPPEFRIRIGVKDNIHFSYLSFIENRLREKFDLIGTPIKTWVKKGRE